MKHVKTFEAMVSENMFTRKESPWMENIKDQVESMSNDEKINFVEDLLEKKKKYRGRLWLYALVPFIGSLFLPNSNVTSGLLVAYFVIGFFLEDKQYQLSTYRDELLSIKDELKDEIDKTELN